VPKRFASEERPGNSVYDATNRMSRLERIGGSDKVLQAADSHSAKRSDVPGLVDNRMGVQRWGLAHGRSPLEETTAEKSGCLAEVWWGQPV
jgi:hypothetical protein